VPLVVEVVEHCFCVLADCLDLFVVVWLWRPSATCAPLPAPLCAPLHPFANAGCAHTNVTVAAGKTYLFRLISPTALVHQVHVCAACLC
jgi:hypothetical protein